MAPFPAFQAAEALFYAANFRVRPQLPHQRHHVQFAFGAARPALHRQPGLSGNKIAKPGRGTTVVDDGLIAALQSGRVAAAGLDVFNNEPAIHPGSLALENVVLLPHIGSATVGTRNAMGFLALEGIAAAVGKKA